METHNNITNNQENQETIDAYLLESMDAKTRAQFEEKMKNSPEFKQEVEEQRAVMQSVEELNLIESLDGFHQEIQEKSIKKWVTPGLLAIAASLLLLIAVSTWAIFFHENSYDRVFATYFKPDPGLPTTMGTNTDYQFYFGMVNYKRKNYSDAIASWEPLYAAEPENDTLVYFLGVANLANDNPRQAEKYFQIAEKISESAFYEEIRYYLALTLLRKDELQEAKSVLKQSKSPANKALLAELQSL
ncbi:hypothetical protein [Aequorivita marisscotiae]|uniref:Tetratricopeptide repeat protein n=1 Tax=Aequorivita marisscotiae TaxID=3040348 RepID=A0ABY8KW49_9FLAO|nr:hypothetical protein [Aequorivita sp. Ant34-E75]WGF93633.1 hypothetical protein QCQ61_05435 [Aequorivita sp. Ant34-E75]